MPRKPQAQPLGPHAGRALADLITRVTVQARSAMAPVEADHRRRNVEGMMDDWEHEIGRFVTELLAPMGSAGESPEWLENMLRRAAQPEHQTDFILSLVVGIAGAFGLIGRGGQIVWQNVLNDLYKANRYVPLSAPDAADAVERNLLSPQEGDAWAAQSGINPEAFAKMVLLTGEPPGIVDMLRLWRRGDLDTETLDRMIAYSRIRTEWTPEVKKLAYEVLPASDVVEGYIKGHIDLAEAKQKWAAAGGMESQFELAALIAGNPIGVEAAARLYNHKLITHEQFAAVIRASRINPQFEPLAELLNHQYLSAFQIHNIVTAGAATPAQGIEWLTQDGIPADQAKALVAGATVVKAAKAKNVSSALVLDSYEAGLITKAQALAQLANLGYHDVEATIEIESYDARRILTLTQQGVTVIRKAFISGKLDAAKAGTDLDALGVDSVLRDHYLKLWALEREAEAKDFTKAEIGSLFKKNIVTEAWAVKQWIALGYTSAQATILLYEYGKSLPNNRPVA